MAGLSKLYIVIDKLLRLDSKDHHWTSKFLRRLRHFIQRSKSTVAKVLLFSYRNFPEHAMFSEAKDVVFTEIKKSQRRALAYPVRAGSRIASKNGRGRSSTQMARTIGILQRAVIQ
jgi:hypothetical protein